jgi:hypothetical protein
VITASRITLIFLLAIVGVRSQVQPAKEPAPDAGATPPVQSSAGSGNATQKPSQSAAPVPSCSQTQRFHLEAGKVYEDAELWEEAEKQYLAAVEDSCSSLAERQLAIQAIKRTRIHRLGRVRFVEFLGSWGQAVDSTAAWLRYSTAGVEVAAFSTPQDEKLGSQIASSFLKLRAKLLNATLPSSSTRRQIMIPIDPGVLSDLSFEAGGFKLAGLASLWRLFLRPRFRVTGGGHVGTGSVTLHAEIWRRHWWFGSRLDEGLIAEMAAGQQLDVVELENFIYAVFLRILYAPR